MLKKNNVFFGFSLALMVTAAMFGGLYLINNILLAYFFSKPILAESTLMIISMGMNLFVLNFYTKYGAYRTGRGIIFFVMVCAAYVIYTYFGEELGFRKS